jgi:hypothetical protein
MSTGEVRYEVRIGQEDEKRPRGEPDQQKVNPQGRPTAPDPYGTFGPLTRFNPPPILGKYPERQGIANIGAEVAKAMEKVMRTIEWPEATGEEFRITEGSGSLMQLECCGCGRAQNRSIGVGNAHNPGCCRVQEKRLERAKAIAELTRHPAARLRFIAAAVVLAMLSIAAPADALYLVRCDGPVPMSWTVPNIDIKPSKIVGAVGGGRHPRLIATARGQEWDLAGGGKCRSITVTSAIPDIGGNRLAVLQIQAERYDACIAAGRDVSTCTEAAAAWADLVLYNNREASKWPLAPHGKAWPMIMPEPMPPPPEPPPPRPGPGRESTARLRLRMLPTTELQPMTPDSGAREAIRRAVASRDGDGDALVYTSKQAHHLEAKLAAVLRAAKVDEKTYAEMPPRYRAIVAGLAAIAAAIE